MPLSFETEDSPALLLDLGHFSLRSDLSADRRRRERKQKEGAGQAKKVALELNEEDFYSKFLFSMTSLQASISTHGLEVNDMAVGKKSIEATQAQQIIDKFDIHFVVLLSKLKSTPLTATKYSFPQVL